MFSLIIVLVSIALVAALALATIYYGGDTFTDANASASASTLVNQSQQVMGAMEMFRVQQGRWPNNLSELAPDYLKQLPSASVIAESGPTNLLVPVAFAQSTGPAWTMPVPGVPTIELTTAVGETICREVNKKTRGDDGILAKAYTTLNAQCYGSTLEGLKVVVTKFGTSLDGALPAEEVATGPVPSPTDPDGWLVPPGEEAEPPSGTVPSGPLSLAIEPGPYQAVSAEDNPYSHTWFGFMNYDLGAGGSSWQMVVTNTGTTNAALSASTFSISGTGWEIEHNSAEASPCSQLFGSSGLAPGQSCTVNAYMPQSVNGDGMRLGVLTVGAASHQFGVIAEYRTAGGGGIGPGGPN